MPSHNYKTQTYLG